MKNIIISTLIIFLFLPFFLQAADFQVKVINNAEDLPENFCTIWKKGDYFISNGEYLVLVGGSPRALKTRLNFPGSNAIGSIISFVPAGENLVSNLSIGSPIIRLKNKTEYLTYSSLKPIKENSQQGNLAFKASAFYKGKDGKKAEIETTYNFHLPQGRIDISSTIKNTGRVDFEDLNYRFYFTPNHRYFFSPFHRKKHPDLNFRVYQKKGYYLGWLNLNPLQLSEDKEESRPGHLAAGEEFQLNYILFVDTQSNDLLGKIYHILNIKPEKASLFFKDFDGNLMEVVVQDVLSPSVFFRSFLKNTPNLEILLPEGAYLVRANFFPAVCEEFLVVKEGGNNVSTLRNLPCQKIKVKIRNSRGEFVPGKITFIGLDPTKTPYFKPEDPIKSGRAWEPFKNSCFPPEEGLEVEVPVGTYLVSASRGLEYSLDQKIVEVLKGKKQKLIFQIDKVVDTKNLVSIDAHMHTHNSDGRVTTAERIKSLVAEGVDVAVATDHNYITDYRPLLNKLGLSKYLATIPGNEVTTSGVIHYNTYPLVCRKDEEGNGVIYPLSNEATLLFEASRKKDPKAILQVNHPRDGRIGYFNNYDLDQESASSARLNFDTSFDILEVMNGPYFHSSNYEAIEDWLHLLNRGYYFPIIGNSDSHSIDKQEPGYCRTYVFYKGEKGANLDWPSLAQALKKGRSFVTNGPLIEFKINGNYTSGEIATISEGEVKISIKVQSAPWISVDEVRLIINGERKIIFSVKYPEKAILKFTEEIGLKLKKDSYISVEALGTKSLFPVLQKKAKAGQLEKATLPYALTNPVFIDVNGNSKFDPPLPAKIKFTSALLTSNPSERRY